MSSQFRDLSTISDLEFFFKLKNQIKWLSRAFSYMNMCRRVCLKRGEKSFFEGVPFVEFMYVVLTRVSGESYRRRFRSVLLCPLLFVCRLSRAINSLSSLNEITGSFAAEHSPIPMYTQLHETLCN